MLSIFAAIVLWWRHRFVVGLLGFIACNVIQVAVRLTGLAIWSASGLLDIEATKVWQAVVTLSSLVGQIAASLAIDRRAAPARRNSELAVPVALVACVTLFFGLMLGGLRLVALLAGRIDDWP